MIDDDFELEESVETEDHPPPKPKKAKKARKTATTSAKDAFGLREGTTRSKAAALYARPEGATLLEVKEELGAIHFNVLTKLEKEGFTVTKTKEAGNNNRTVTRYHLQKTTD